MSILNELTPVEVRRAGWEALREKLGPAGALKFILDYDRGEGNYTELRKKYSRESRLKILFRI
uniref:Uncharacterized protein n=1 Tax=uncultured Desulfobacterium sp. TaxID=201089 RepID=E1YJK6_9BACT|nr:hypothetical protein N47_E49720 [uncultured Desulfobacterium sp.]